MQQVFDEIDGNDLLAENAENSRLWIVGWISGIEKLIFISYHWHLRYILHYVHLRSHLPLSLTYALCNERRCCCRFVLPCWRQYALQHVVPGESVDSWLDENQAEFAVNVLSVAFQMLTDAAWWGNRDSRECQAQTPRSSLFGALCCNWRSAPGWTRMEDDTWNEMLKHIVLIWV